MKIVISATNALVKWLKLDLPRIPSPDGKRIGTQPLVSDENTLAWQCHVLKSRKKAVKAVVIAVESRSRYVIIIPFDAPPTQAELERELTWRWANEAVHWMVEGGALSEYKLPEVIRQIKDTAKNFLWYRNVDLSVNGHVTDAEIWVMQDTGGDGFNHFDEADAFGLGIHINQMFKRVKGKGGQGERFYPVHRLLDDALYRFAKGLARQNYPNTPEGDYPRPYSAVRSSTAKVATDNIPANVISLADYAKGKGRRR